MAPEAERVARETGQLDLVVHAYGDVIAAGGLGATLADELGSRLVALEGDCSVEGSFFVDALLRVLEIAPRARRALDRVKLALGSQAHWEALFRLYDRAIDAAASDDERAELLGEAAFAARDLASDAERAIAYFASIHSLRPDDDAACAALERLYERQGRRAELADLLAGRAAREKGAARHRLQHRIAALRLDLGEIAEANAAVQTMLDEGAPAADAASLLERLAFRAGPGCGRRARDLVRLRLSADGGAPGAFARVMGSLDAEVAANPGAAAHVYRAVLLSAVVAWRRAPTDAVFQDAADGAWRAVGALSSAFLHAGDARRACRVLERAARLPFERERRRELLGQAVQLCSDGPGDARRAIRLYSAIFEDDAADALAAASIDRFAGLLEAAGENGKLARLWERQAAHRARTGDCAEEAALCLRAAAAWERHGSDDRAVAACDRAVALLENVLNRPGAAEVLKRCIAMCGGVSAKDRALLHQRLARALRRSGDREGALAHLRIAAGLQPAQTTILDDLGQVALEAGRLDVAASAYRTLLLALRHPVGQEQAVARCRVFLKLGRVALLRGDPAHAASLLESALDEAPDAGADPEALDGALGIQRDAETMLRDPADDRAGGRFVGPERGPALARLEDTSRRLEGLLRRAIEARQPGADRARLRVFLARAQMVRSDSGEELEALLSSILDEDPDQAEASQLLAGLLERDGRFDEVATMLERGLERSASPAAGACAIGLVDLLLGADRAEQALAAFERLLARAPQHAERLAALIVARAEATADGPEKAALLLHAASLLEAQVGHPERALPLLERARATHPESIEAALALARVQAGLGRPGEALAALLEIAARNRGKRLPALGRVYLAIGKAHLAADDLVEALDALKAGFAVDPRSTELALQLGLLAIDLGDDKTAERALYGVAMAAARKPGSNEGTDAAERIVAIYHLAALADAGGDAPKALRWAAMAVRQDPAHAGARMLLNRLRARAPALGVQMR
jgi:tetratricopeptide (TPR) repeat protein